MGIHVLKGFVFVSEIEVFKRLKDTF